MTTVNIIGAGKVGATFIQLIGAHSALQLGDVHSRRSDAVANLLEGYSSAHVAAAITDMRPADLWLITVPDDQISLVADALSYADVPASVALHCSGFLSSQALGSLASKGWHVGSCHPVRSFADPSTAAADFAGTYCGIEGDDAATHLANAFIDALGGHPFPVTTDSKAIYHAAAVFSNNFAVVLQAIAQEAWAEAGVPAEIAKALGDDLLNNAAVNIAQTDPRQALTGPAARGDMNVLQQQQAALTEWNSDIADLYAKLSKMAGRLKTNGQVT
ncbi:hypothetical protein BVC71_14275 [Marivivens niveibacter]|uniref:DUF2520 domain-containing protein n=1 Tax=Marivivens niveibacter TaxID=1930667 RepID=A0A251WW93_9RHOB|nr:Rossmann-like and DUF2520 domain-containing protein [Marivivens niveibacter]OUD08334.1 hypothetical protein BVC71_14275 [Marivivens niveibacter]